MSDRARLTAKDVLSFPVKFPNESAALRLSRLVGLEDHIHALERDIRLIFDPMLARNWSKEQYGDIIAVVEIIEETVPLIIFEGDIGTGKTALAETIGQQVASKGGYGVHLVKMSTRVRGTGYVGEMGTLLAESFRHMEELCKRKGEPVLFMIDEADSVLTSRALEQHHHEDKSGVNTILQHLDNLKTRGSQIAVLAITNRVGVLDPAVLRRATAVLKFQRPNRNQRKVLLKSLFGNALSDADIRQLVDASEPASNEEVSLSYSDLTLRFAVPAVRSAVWLNEGLNVEALVATLRTLVPTRSVSTSP